jgi:hypothetical protein
MWLNRSRQNKRAVVTNEDGEEIVRSPLAVVR